MHHFKFFQDAISLFIEIQTNGLIVWSKSSPMHFAPFFQAAVIFALFESVVCTDLIERNNRYFCITDDTRRLLIVKKNHTVCPDFRQVFTIQFIGEFCACSCSLYSGEYKIRKFVSSRTAAAKLPYIVPYIAIRIRCTAICLPCLLYTSPSPRDTR